MSPKQHNRQYDLVVYGATGYTGRYTARYVTTHLPTNLRWAVAGRSQAKLEAVAAECAKLHPDRLPPAVEVVGRPEGPSARAEEDELAGLARKTFILITTVGPYGRLGEPAFRACAENGTHYLDVTGEVPFVARMLRRYEAAAAASGALMFPQIGIESAPPDLVAFALASAVRARYAASPTADVVVSLHQLKGGPSGGTIASALGLLENFSLSEVRAAYAPYALSPVPAPTRRPPRPEASLLSRLTGLVTVPHLGLLTTSPAGATDAAYVQRSWGLLSSLPSRRETQAYGPNFSFREYMRPPRGGGWLSGFATHLFLMVLGLVMATPVLRSLAKRWVGMQPGQGPEAETAEKDELEYRAVATRDGGNGEKVLCRAGYKGSAYYFTGILAAEAAATILQEDLDLPGGVYTAACLGQPYIDRLERAGFRIETWPLEEKGWGDDM
ncbi:hypothetical protein VTJ83DRAFT_804 [Remersonia thermophila]|uniref:Saccharopine dehydrogenase NADP binding domain-containing protein n=1 Tax=Remersonia thermophila TaxID=72144 RepID=A0ABR4DM95_9PEZI